MSLINQINAQTLTNLASGKTTNGSPSSAIGPGQSNGDRVSLSQALRNGASIFANSFTRLNGALSAFTITQDSLEKLLEITNGLIKLADRAAESGLSDTERSSLNRRFQKGVDEFRKILDSTTASSFDLLDKSDLRKILENSGVNPLAATALANAFSRIGGSGEQIGSRRIKSEDQSFRKLINSTDATGTFQAPNVISPFEGGDTLFTLGDLNNNGHNDLLLVSASGVFSVQLNDGNGSFTELGQWALPAYGQPVLSDINGDGVLDLVITESSGDNRLVYTMIGNGDGTFQAAETVEAGWRVRNVALADVTGNDALDLISTYDLPPASTVNAGAREQTDIVMFGTATQEVTQIDFNGGDSSFRPAYPAHEMYFSLWAPSGQFNFYFVDGANGSAPGGPGTDVEIDITGLGWQDVVDAVAATIDARPEFSAIADGDKVIITNAEGGDVTDWHPGTTDFGNWDSRVLDQGTDSPLTDGSYFTFNTPSNTYYVWYDIGEPSSPPDLETLVTVELDWGDSASDVASKTAAVLNALFDVDASADGDTLTITNANSGTVTDASEGAISGLDITVTTQGAASSVNIANDSIQVSSHPYQTGDVVTLSTLFSATLPSGLAAATEYYIIKEDDNTIKFAESLENAELGIAIDLTTTGNGLFNITLVVDPEAGDQGIMIQAGNGDGTFGEKYYISGMSNQAFVVADFNGDGHLDIASTDRANGISVALNNGDGTFSEPVLLGSEGFNLLTVGDIDGDGIPDLIGAGDESLSIAVFLGNGDGTFAAPINTDFVATESLVVHDYNGDGHLDVLAAPVSFDGIYKLDGDGTGSFNINSGINGPYILDLGVGDLNGDGFEDLFYTGKGSSEFFSRFADTMEVSTLKSEFGLARGTLDPLEQDIKTRGNALVAKETLVKLRDFIERDLAQAKEISKALATATQFALEASRTFDDLAASSISDANALARKLVEELRKAGPAHLLNLHSGLDTQLAKELLVE